MSSECFTVATIQSHSLLLRWPTVLCALHSIHVLNIHQSGCNAVWLLHRWCHMKLLPSLQVLRRQYNRAPVYSVTIESHKCRRHMCSAVTCYLHFWQNVRHLLCATAVTQEWNRNQNKSQHRKLTLEKKIIPLLLPGIKAVPFWSWVHRSTTEPSLFLTCGVPQPCLGTSSLHFVSAASQSLGPVLSILYEQPVSLWDQFSPFCICSLSVFRTSSLHFVSVACQSVMEWVTTCLHMTLILQIWFFLWSFHTVRHLFLFFI